MTLDTVAAASQTDTPASFGRLAGVAGLLAAAIGLVINVLLVPPAPRFDALAPEVAAYYMQEADGLAIGVGLRFVAQFLALLFAVGLFRLATGAKEGVKGSWALLGLVGAVCVPAIGAAANSVEAVAVWGARTLAEQPVVFTALWGLGIALFNALLVPWAALILGFSIAGRSVGLLPGWLQGLGIITAVVGLVGASGTISTMDNGWGKMPAYTAFALIPIWLVITSVQMIRKS